MKTIKSSECKIENFPLDKLKRKFLSLFRCKMKFRYFQILKKVHFDKKLPKSGYKWSSLDRQESLGFHFIVQMRDDNTFIVRDAEISLISRNYFQVNHCRKPFPVAVNFQNSDKLNIIKTRNLIKMYKPRGYFVRKKSFDFLWIQFIFIKIVYQNVR